MYSLDNANGGENHVHHILFMKLLKNIPMVLNNIPMVKALHSPIVVKSRLVQVKHSKQEQPN